MIPATQRDRVSSYKLWVLLAHTRGYIDVPLKCLATETRLTH